MLRLPQKGLGIYRLAIMRQAEVYRSICCPADSLILLHFLTGHHCKAFNRPIAALPASAMINNQLGFGIAGSHRYHLTRRDSPHVIVLYSQFNTGVKP